MGLGRALGRKYLLWKSASTGRGRRLIIDDGLRGGTSKNIFSGIQLCGSGIRTPCAFRIVCTIIRRRLCQAQFRSLFARN
jgi:hypothetical protein